MDAGTLRRSELNALWEALLVCCTCVFASGACRKQMAFGGKKIRIYSIHCDRSCLCVVLVEAA